MKAKVLTYAIAAGCILGGIVFGQSLELSGTLTCTNSNQYELQCDGITWVIKRTPNTSTIPDPPTLNAPVIVHCKSPDAQRKESPTWTPVPCSTPKPTGPGATKP